MRASLRAGRSGGSVSSHSGSPSTVMGGEMVRRRPRRPSVPSSPGSSRRARLAMRLPGAVVRARAMRRGGSRPGVPACSSVATAAGDEAAGGCVEGTGDAVEGVHARGAALLEFFDGVGVHARFFGEGLLGEAVEHAVFADAFSDMLHECGPAFPGVWLFPG